MTHYRLTYTVYDGFNTEKLFRVCNSKRECIRLLCLFVKFTEPLASENNVKSAARHFFKLIKKSKKNPNNCRPAFLVCNVSFYVEEVKICQ